MKTGDVVLDAQGRTYQVGPLLGRGLWGKSYLVRHGDSRAEFVMKCPLSRDDFKGDVPLTDTLLGACAEACTEQAMVLGEGTHVFLPPLQSRQAEDGSPLLILPRFTTTLDRRMSQGGTLSEVLTVLLAVCTHLQKLSEDGTLGGYAHGNLRPSNILLNERGEVLLTDVATPAASRALGQLHAISPEPNHYLPPEVLTGTAELTEGADTYALGMILYRAVMTPVEGDEGKSAPDLPTAGLDKAARVALKDAAVARLQAEDSNPRFHARFADRLSNVLNRALSKETAPSPPFRFGRVAELAPRLEELHALIRPTITTVGKSMLDRPPGSDTYTTTEEVKFGVTVGASNGVDTYEEIACGIAVFDAEADQRIRDVDCAYTVDRHPSGRYRFTFRVMDLPPGRYVTRVAFAIRDSGHPPVTAEAHYEVRAAAGYVPPATAPSTQPLPFMDTSMDQDVETAVTRPDLPDPSALQPNPVAAALDDALEDPEFGAKPETTQEYIFDETPAPVPPPVAPPPPPAPPAPVAAPSPPAVATHAETERTEPAVQVDSKLPEPDPLSDIVKRTSWTDVPLPGDGARDDLPPPPVADDDWDDPPESPIARFVELVKGDLYLQFMVGAGAFIVLLMIILLFLRA